MMNLGPSYNISVQPSVNKEASMPLCQNYAFATWTFMLLHTSKLIGFTFVIPFTPTCPVCRKLFPVIHFNFLPRCIVCRAVFPTSVCPSVCLSVCLSVKRVNCDKTRVVKRSSKIRSLIYKFEFEFSFLAFAIRSVIVPQGHAFNKLHNCIVCISNAWLHALHRRPAR